MHQILRLSRRDGDEWVRLLSSVLAPFPHSQTISVNQITEGNMEGVADDIKEACNNTETQAYTYTSKHTHTPTCKYTNTHTFTRRWDQIHS